MGQYFIIVNKTKKEYIHPHAFGDGLKLMEFGSSASSTLTGLTLLLRQSTGNGGGDFHPDPTMFNWYEEAKALVKKSRGEKRKDAKRTLEHIEYIYGAKDWTAHTEQMVIEFLGRWAGDKIVIVGDYDDSKLYQTAQDNYRDISYEVLELMFMDAWTANSLRKGFQTWTYLLDKMPPHLQKLARMPVKGDEE